MSMLDPRRSPLAYSVAIGVALISTILTFDALAGLAEPTKLDPRWADAQRDLKILRHAERKSTSGDTLAAGTLCRSDPAIAAESLRSRLTALAPLQIKSVFVAVEPASPNAPDFTPVVFRLEAKGAYADVTHTLGDLARSRPVIFADTVDITSEGPFTALKLKGKVLCAIHASS
jgi:hypothetical protein